MPFCAPWNQLLSITLYDVLTHYLAFFIFLFYRRTCVNRLRAMPQQWCGHWKKWARSARSWRRVWRKSPRKLIWRDIFCSIFVWVSKSISSPGASEMTMITMYIFISFFQPTLISFLAIFSSLLLSRATAAGFSKLSERISHLEDALLLQNHLQGVGDQELPPEEDHNEEADYERRWVCFCDDIFFF